MKTINIFGVIVALVIVGIATMNVSMNSQKSAGLSDISLANIEALAGETSTYNNIVICVGNNVICLGNGQNRCCR